MKVSIKNIPCIKTRCLLLPICKTKKSLKCSLVYNYINNKIHQRNSNRYYNLVNNKILELFPNTIWIISNEKATEVFFLIRNEPFNFKC